jgi:hypothetical protein
LYNSY